MPHYSLTSITCHSKHAHTQYSYVTPCVQSSKLLQLIPNQRCLAPDRCRQCFHCYTTLPAHKCASHNPFSLADHSHAPTYSRKRLLLIQCASSLSKTCQTHIEAARRLPKPLQLPHFLSTASRASLVTPNMLQIIMVT